MNYEEKKDYIDYLFNKYIENNPDYFQEHYDYALREICQSREDLKHWEKLLKTKYANRPAFLDEIEGI